MLMGAELALRGPLRLLSMTVGIGYGFLELKLRLLGI